MATHDYVIDNQSAPSLRADLNSALQAIVTQNSSGIAPATTYANMIWYDTANNQLKKRNEANSAWITLGTVDEAESKFTPNSAITVSEIAAATLVTSSETIASNNNDTTIPTSAAVKAYADALSNAPSTAEVLSATAGANAGAVGTYAWLKSVNDSTSRTIGATFSGSAYSYAGATVDSNNGVGYSLVTSGTPSGTWRVMGFFSNAITSSRRGISLALRIA